MRKQFVAIIGHRNSGKSTIIQSLTGCPRRGGRDTVVDTASGRTIEVLVSSPQEDAISLAELRRLLAAAKRSELCNGIVCALQPSMPTKRLSLDKVLEEAAAAGFRLSVFVLSRGRNGSALGIASVLPRLPKGVHPRPLDARRFAHVNAAIVNKYARIVS